MKTFTIAKMQEGTPHTIPFPINIQYYALKVMSATIRNKFNKKYNIEKNKCNTPRFSRKLARGVSCLP